MFLVEPIVEAVPLRTMIAIEVAAFAIPAAMRTIAVVPPVGDPMLSVTRFHPATGTPDMVVVLPAPGTRRPHVTDARRGNHFEDRRRRRHSDGDVEADLGGPPA